MYGNKSILKKNIILSLCFGLIIGLIFPIFAYFFVNYKSVIHLFFFVISCIAAGLLVGFISYYITKTTIIKIINKVTNEIDLFTKGEGNLTKKINLSSNDELGILINGFNNLINKLHDIVKIIKNNIINTSNTTGELSSGLKHTTQSIKEIINSINYLNDTHIKQSSKIEISVYALEELNKSILIVLTNIMEFFSQMDTLTNILIEQSKSVDNLLIFIYEMSKKIDKKEAANLNKDDFSLTDKSMNFINETLSAMEKYQQNIVKIEDLVNLINDTTSRTNLLAINASIEASNAGEAGTGFQIVAKEVRVLADSSKKMTGDIETVLNVIKKDMNESIEKIGKNKNEFNNVLLKIKNISNSLINGIKNIQGITNEIKGIYNNIGTMLITLKENMENLKNTSDNCKISINEVKDTSIIIKDGMQKINESSLNIDESTHNIIKKTDNLFISLKFIDDEIKKIVTMED